MKSKGGTNERDNYYKFYLDSAQRAIEMMRKQHKESTINQNSGDQVNMENEPEFA